MIYTEQISMTASLKVSFSLDLRIWEEIIALQRTRAETPVSQMQAWVKMMLKWVYLWWRSSEESTPPPPSDNLTMKNKIKSGRIIRNFKACGQGLEHWVEEAGLWACGRVALYHREPTRLTTSKRK